jgi:hypothetical protein
MAEANNEGGDGRDDPPIHRLMDQLLNLNRIVSLGGHLVFDQNLYNLRALPSHAVVTVVAPYTDKLFEVFPFGDNIVPYVAMKPFLKDGVLRFDRLLDIARTISPEPPTVERAQGFVYNPENVGIPMTHLDPYPVYRQRLINALQGSCSKLPTDGENIHFRRANFAMPGEVAIMKNLYTDMLLLNSSQVRREFIRHWMYTNDGLVPDQAPLIVSQSTRIERSPSRIARRCQHSTAAATTIHSRTPTASIGATISAYRSAVRTNRPTPIRLRTRRGSKT